MRGTRNRGSIAGVTECPRNLARIRFLNNGFDIMLGSGV